MLSPCFFVLGEVILLNIEIFKYLQVDLYTAEKNMKKIINRGNKTLDLAIAALIVFSTVAVTADTTNDLNKSSANSYEVNHTNSCDMLRTDEVIWDNGLPGSGSYVIASQLDTNYSFNAQTADDFMFNGVAEITGVVWYGGFFDETTPDVINPCDFNIYIYEDDGTGNAPTGGGTANPETTKLYYSFENVLGVKIGEYSCSYEVGLDPVFNAQHGVKYWIVMQAVFNYPPQWGWLNLTDNQIQLSPSVQGFNSSKQEVEMEFWTVHGGGDMAFKLKGTIIDNIPPVTDIDLDGDMQGGNYVGDVTVTLTATDEGDSGVNYTKYKVDEGSWGTYDDPFVVSGLSEHTVYYYSVDNADNAEDEQTETFTIQEPGPLEIEINGPYTAEVDEDISFSATVTGGVKPYIYNWDFGDEEGTANVKTPTYAYDEAGVYTVELTVTDDQEESTRVNTTATITDAPSGSDLEIIGIRGGLFCVTATVNNTGKATDAYWRITLDGDFIFGVESNGTVEIKAGETAKVRSGIILGIGMTEITVKVSADGKSDKYKASAFVIGPFIIITERD